MTTTEGATGYQELADRAELTNLVAKQGYWLDEQRFDEIGSVFAENASAHTPGGQALGLEAMAAQARRNHERFEHTQHVTTNIQIDLDGDHAVVRANQVATYVEHVPHPAYTSGTRVRYDAVRTPDGWRFSRFEINPLWSVTWPAAQG